MVIQVYVKCRFLKVGYGERTTCPVLMSVLILYICSGILNGRERRIIISDICAGYFSIRMNVVTSERAFCSLWKSVS